MTFTNLLYVGDVPVEASYHGSALLYRLLSDYPPERLMVIETAAPSEPKRRLPNVNYVAHPVAKPRWLNTRFHPYAVAWFSQAGTRRGIRIAQSLNGRAYEGVLTVAHGFGWLAAAGVARAKNVPLHLMVHDDWPRVADIAPAFRSWLDEQFAGVYRQAKSRFCVSPAMARAYSERYGERAEVIYPSRARDCREFTEPPARNDRPFTMAFAGTINSQGYVEALHALQAALKTVSGRLIVFGPQRIEDADFRGLLDADKLLMCLREEADALFVPMSFDAADRANMELAFPSKLADYTATGLPLLIYGPSYCSAVAWARENEGVAEIVESPADLNAAIDRLANDRAHRLALGRRALDAGRKYFSHAQVQQTFIRALSA
ncbi:MAG TPA: glycosyltransferase [Pyrinomonadaceae bacterium]|nr:glycosyltransferase [Pyrinomonadaceae bacterium]